MPGGNYGYYIYGTSQNDVLIGTNSSDTIYGYEGDDILNGSALGDVLYGGSGNDTLFGGNGNDTLDGGGGQDVFVFDMPLSSLANVDTIQNYVVADDTIQLENAIFTALTGTGTLSSDAFCIGAAAQDASDRIIYDSATGYLSYDADGTGASAAVQFAKLVGVTGTLTNADFVVI